jgi:asparagine synthetase B (glutamine-hydrolysing)
MEVEMMARARAHGAECVLSGAGGDDIFDGEPRAIAARARRGELLRAVRAARAHRGVEAPRSRTVAWVLRPLLASLTPTAVRLRLARRRPPSIPAWAGPALREYLERMRERSLAQLPRLLSEGVFVDPDDVERHRVNIAWLRHQEEIASGIEERDPFLDRELIATVDGFDPEWLLTGGIRRGLFRAALADLLPAPFLDREDKARFEPALMRVTGAPAGLERMRDLASADELASLGLVEPQPFRRAFEAFLAAPDEGPPWMTTWAALGVERFLRARRAQQRADAP